MLKGLNGPAVWAGLTAFVWYAFGAVPLHIGVSQQLGLSMSQTSSWIFVVWFGGALTSIGASFAYRQPIPVAWTIPGLIYLGSLAGRFEFAELVGANLVAALILLVLGLLGVGGRVLRWLPPPIIMGMFGGSVLGYVNRMVAATVNDFAVAGTAVACYGLGRYLKNPRVPPVGLAVVGGGVAVAMTGTAVGNPVEWALPLVSMPDVRFSGSAIVAVSLPMVVLAMGLGNVQGLGFLRAQGYDVPVDRVSVLVGLNSVLNALLGGHPATVARTGVAILASPEAGPKEERYWSVVVASFLTLGLAFAATPVASLLAVLPQPYVFAIAGLAILSSFQGSLVQAFSGPMSFGALTAFVVATTPFTLFGITSAFWSIVAGLGASMLVEGAELADFWQGSSSRLPVGRAVAARV